MGLGVTPATQKDKAGGSQAESQAGQLSKILTSKYLEKTGDVAQWLIIWRGDREGEEIIHGARGMHWRFF